MHRQSRSWLIGTVISLAVLLVSWVTPAAIPGKNDPLRGEKFSATHKIQQGMAMPKMDPKELRSLRQQAMPHRVTKESLCTANIYWNGGETTATASGAQAVAWTAGSGELYFASVNDMTHPTEVAWGDPVLTMFFVGNDLYTMGANYLTEWDVTDPASPSLVLYMAIGFDSYDVRSFTVSDNEQYWFIGFNSDGILIYDVVNGTSCGYIPDDYNGDGYSEDWTGLIYDGTDNVLIATDFFAASAGSGSVSQGAWVFDLSDLTCCQWGVFGSDDPTLGMIPLYGGISGNYNSGAIYWKAPYLYGVWEPKYAFMPMGWNDPAFGQTYVTIMQVPDITNPANHFYIREYENSTDDITMMVPRGTGLMFSTLQNHIFTCDDQMVTVTGLGTINVADPASKTFDMAFTQPATAGASGKGFAANGIGGERSFNDIPFAETGSYITGGEAAYDVAVAGNIVYVADGAAGVAILQGPTSLATITINAMGLASAQHVALSPDGLTLFVAGGNSMSIVDVTTPASPVVKSTMTPASAFTITSLAAYSNFVAAGFDNGSSNGGVIAWTYANPAAPVTLWVSPQLYGVKNLIYFALPAYPLTPFLAVNADAYLNGNGLTYGRRVYILSSSTGAIVNTGAGDQLKTIDSTLTGAGIMSLLQYSTPVGNFLYLVGDLTGATMTAPTTPVNGVNVATVTDPVNPFLGGIVGGVNVTGLDLFAAYGGEPGLIAWTNLDGWAVVGIPDSPFSDTTLFWQVDLKSDPRTPAINPAGWEPSYYYNGDVVALKYFNGNVYAAMGPWGITGQYFNSDVDLPTVVGSSSWSPLNAVRPNDVQSNVTLTWAFSDLTTGITQVDMYIYNGVTYKFVGTSTHATAPGVTGTYAFTFDVSALATGAGPWWAVADVYDGGCNRVEFADPGTAYLANLYPTAGLSSFVPAPYSVSGGICSTGASNWYVCTGSLSMNWAASDPVGNVPGGVTEVSLWLDGALKTILYTGAPIISTSGTYALNTLTLAEGPHSIYLRTVDAAGLQKKSVTYTFKVHNASAAPKTYVVQPVSGDVVSGNAIPLSANVVTVTGSLPIAKVEFFLDPVIPFVYPSGTKIGTATAQDPTTGNWIAATPWNSTSTPYGDHIIVAVATEKAPTGYSSCTFQGVSPINSFRLVQYTAMTVTATATPTTGNIPLSVAFAANVTGGAPPFTYAWAFGDSSTGTGQAASHTYTTAGTFTWTLTVTDATAATKTATGSVTAINPIVPPTVTGVSKMQNPFRLKVLGSNFHSNCTIYIDGVSVPQTLFKSSSELIAKKGSALKAMVPKGTLVHITVKNNDDGGVSATFSYTR